MPYSESDRADLVALAELAGLDTSPALIRVVTELLAMHIAPEDIYNLLRQMSSLEESKNQGNGAQSQQH